ncbi:cohesin domain-containing protein [Methylomonas sp. MK1]|uniref:cohesin domain-containing protein n=1 Tax=Methylomonas sp. MK1 TaxID=1131552 RepID=UPI000369E920|nr:cohesin domain-containing protein [Methylomonas sp. MK1]
MNKHLLTKLLALAFVGFFQTTEAATLNLKFTDDTNIRSFAKGSFFDVKIYINSVNDLAGFDFDLTYNSTNLFAQSLTSSSIFGADTEALASISTITPGVGAALGKIHFAELLSGGSVTTGLNITAPTLLGTVKFKALNISAGNALSIIPDPIYTPAQLLFLSDGSGPATTTIGATVHVTAPAAVPLPTSAFLFVPGLLGVLGFGRKRAVKG